MNKKDVFDAWAPSGACWSDWVKPVLFASLPENDVEPREAELDIEREISPTWTAPGVALVLDLPGDDSVEVGLALAKHGIRPVPLFNALPGFPNSLVDVDRIQSALVASAQALRNMALAADAPPAFLLDSLRRARRPRRREDGPRDGRDDYDPWRAFRPRDQQRWENRDRWQERYFDNRSVSFTTDFPSGTTLCARGIRQLILVRRWSLQVPGDLVATLAGWHRAGLTIEIQDIGAEHVSVPWVPPRLLWLHRLWFQVLIPLLLMRDRTGAFGGYLPPASS